MYTIQLHLKLAATANILTCKHEFHVQLGAKQIDMCNKRLPICVLPDQWKNILSVYNLCILTAIAIFFKI